MTKHRSVVFVKNYTPRGLVRGTERPTNGDQFRYVLRLAVACHEASVPYDVEWGMQKTAAGAYGFGANLTCEGNIPQAKPLPKPPRLQVAPAWKPRPWDAEYRLDAYHDSITQKKQPGFVIDHSSGLCLVRPSSTGEWEDSEGSGPFDGWLLTHQASGKGFGVTITLKQAADALLLVAGTCDWHLSIAELFQVPAAKQANLTILAKYSKGFSKRQAADRLRRSAVAA